MIDHTMTHRCQPAQPTRSIEALSEISEAGERFLIKFFVVGLAVMLLIGLHGMMQITEPAPQQAVKVVRITSCPAVDGKE